MDKPECTLPKGVHRSTEKTSMDGSGHYEIKVQGHLDEGWSDWFGSLIISYEDDGFSVLTGFIQDQSALHGILAQIRDLGLSLVSLIRREQDIQRSESLK